MMDPARYDIEVQRGAGWSRTLTWLDENGDPISWAGYTAKLQIKTSHDEAEAALVTLTEIDGLTLGADGSIAIELTSEQIVTLPLGRTLVYDLFVTAAGIEPIKLLYGDITITPRVTVIE